MSTTVQTLTTSSKKRKHPPDGSASTPKKQKKDKKKNKKSKGKERAADASEFRVVQASLAVSIPPMFASNPQKGVEEMLDSMVMRYIPALRGVVLSHSSVHFQQPTARIKADCPYALCDVGFNSMIWSPDIGMCLNGKVNLCSPDHISLLVHQTFNVSIPRHHIPEDTYVFEYGPAENDPEFGPESSTAMQAETEDDKNEPVEPVEVGRWVHRLTGEKVGGEDGMLQFTVIGMTIANQMLSLIGSIQENPFSPEHIAKPAIVSPQEASSRKSKDVPMVDAVEELEADSENEDGFTALQKLKGAEPPDAQKEKTEKKRKRQEKKKGVSGESKKSKKAKDG